MAGSGSVGRSGRWRSLAVRRMCVMRVVRVIVPMATVLGTHPVVAHGMVMRNDLGLRSTANRRAHHRRGDYAPHGEQDCDEHNEQETKDVHDFSDSRRGLCPTARKYARSDDPSRESKPCHRCNVKDGPACVFIGAACGLRAAAVSSGKASSAAALATSHTALQPCQASKPGMLSGVTKQTANTLVLVVPIDCRVATREN